MQSRGEGLSAAASRSPPALVCRLGRSARPRRAVPSGEPPPRQRPRASSGVRAVGAAAACRRLVRGHSKPLSGAPGGRFQSVPFLRRPSQGLRFSRRIRRRAPEALSTGGNNTAAAEIWARLLLLKIDSAGVREMAWRCGGARWLALGVDQHLPASFYSRGLGASRGRVFAPGFLWLGGQAPASPLGAFVSHPRYPAPGSRAWPARPSPCLGGSLAGRLGPVSSPGRVLLPLDLNGEACVASTAVYLEALRRSERVLRPRGRLG